MRHGPGAARKTQPARLRRSSAAPGVPIRYRAMTRTVRNANVATPTEGRGAGAGAPVGFVSARTGPAGA
ncbi:hypothetical protein LX36DRAFT_664487 [Colletotrichum falcatum]|nr:hypothetical protein LX36DRAFT_664487 [Colletotrichum falcatum]